MDISNNQNQMQPRPVSVFAHIFCCIVFFACSTALPVLTFYIGTEGIDPAIPLTLALITLALCVVFALALCKKPLFLGCAAAVALFLALLSPFFSALFAALLCATVAGAALFAASARLQNLAVCLIAATAYGVSFSLTKDPLLAAFALLPLLAALAFGICYKKKYSVIISIGSATGALLAAYVLLIGADALLAGMPLSVQGVTDYIKAFHATVSAELAASMQLMAETPEIATQLAPMLGGSITPEAIAEFSDSVSTAVISMLPGVSIMMAWILCFIAHRGFTAQLVRGMDKKDYPAHLTTFEPSVPTAIFMILCYAAMLLSSLSARGELITFIALNLLLSLLPMMTVCGILSIISNIKHATVKWPLLLTYALAIIFLGVAVVPMVAFFGSFAVITGAIARALEKKFRDFKGGQ